MASSVATLNVGPDHLIPVELTGLQSATVTVPTSGGTVYYADKPYATAANNQGSIAPGASFTFTIPVWLFSSQYSTLSVQYLDTAPSFLAGVVIGEGGNSQHTAIFTPRLAVLPEPVMTLQPQLPNLVCAMDIAPSAGALSQVNNGFAWMDICDGPVQAAITYVGTSTRVGNGAKLGGSTQVGDVSTRKFAGATAIPLILASDWDGNRNPQIYLIPQTATNPNVLLGYDGSDVFTGPPVAPATTAVRGGFLYLSTVAGAPTGVPAQVTAAWSAMRYDSTNHKLWVYDTVAAAWRGIVLT